MKKLFLFIVLIIVFNFIVKAQTNISGIVNIYTPVTNISNCVCPTINCANITVNSATGFSVGDRVLLIQMKGARVDSSNTPSHGSIINLYDAGNYEFADIASVAGNVITTAEPLKETYFTNASPKDSACVQLIRVPVYPGNVNITGTLTAQAWNGRTGGVLAFRTSGTVTLNADITVSGLGFQAARKMSASSTCGNDTALYYQSTGWQHTACTSCDYNYDDAVTRIVTLASYGGCGGGGPGGSPCYTNRMHTNDGRMAGYKGEGIAANTFRKVFNNGNIALFDKGRGRWGNAGGGGGNHNGGGGGGSNYGAGGRGGNAYNNTSACPTGTLADRKGYGGAALTPTGSKVFMGGGGGEGHDNGGNGSTGTPGGGLIFIKATSITNNGSYTITANGINQTFVAFGDGSGGGGAGGSVLLDVGSFTNAISVSARGGDGGSHNNNNCHGTGGGGGGGVIWFSGSSANVTTNVTGGANGTQVAASIDCGDINWGATAGSNGYVRTGLDGGYTAFFNMNTCSSGPLPIELISFSASEINNKVHLEWATSTEKNNEFFTVEKSADGRNFTEFSRKEGAGNHVGILNYSLIDNTPFPGINYYRLIQSDFDGTQTVSKIVTAYVDQRKSLIVHPNPANEYFVVEMPWHVNYSLYITDLNGRRVLEKSEMNSGSKIDIETLSKGIYFLYITADDQVYFQKLIKTNH